MIKFELQNSVDPILKAYLERGDVLFCESGAMVAMDECLSLIGKSKGGFFSSLGRKMLNSESFFQQKIDAPDGPGSVMLSPKLAGDIRLLEVGPKNYIIADGCYLASTESVELSSTTQGLGKALFASTGSGLQSFFIMQAAGHGILAVSGFGSLAEVEVSRDKPVLVDNGHLVAWDADLKYEVAISTAHKGFFGTMVESVTSGEGVVLKFTGTGKVIVGSRNRTEFLNWIIGKMPVPNK